MTNDELYEARESVAQKIYEEFDFGFMVLDQQRWEATVPGDSLTLNTYLDDPDQPQSVIAQFKVEFAAGTADPTSVTAYDTKGNPFGKPSNAQPPFFG